MRKAHTQVKKGLLSSQVSPPDEWQPVRHFWAICHCSVVCTAVYPANSSSKALASCKSAVSKPSVNQP
jgi:hypothetical protein